MSNAATSEPRTLTATGVLVTDDGTFALLDDGTRVRLPGSIASGIAAGMVAGGQGVSVQGTHSAFAPRDPSAGDDASSRARASDERRRSPTTGRFKRNRGMSKIERDAEEDMLHSERMTRREIARCLKRRGWSTRMALSRGMTYIQAERIVNATRGLRGEAAAIAAVDVLNATKLCDQIWAECGHDTLKQRDETVTDTPLSELTEPSPAVA